MKIIKVNLGCGRAKKDGWINVDSDPCVGPDLILDLTRPNPPPSIQEKFKDYSPEASREIRHYSLPWEDGTVDAVACENLWDSLTRRVFSVLMWEIHRVLRSGGRLEFVQMDVAKNPDMGFGWPGFQSPITRHLLDFYIVGTDAHENWKEQYNLPGFSFGEIRHNENGVMIGRLEKP